MGCLWSGISEWRLRHVKRYGKRGNAPVTLHASDKVPGDFDLSSMTGRWAMDYGQEVTVTGRVVPKKKGSRRSVLRI